MDIRMETIEALESQVRYYVRQFPVMFDRAEKSFLYDNEGRTYIDFFCGASSLNYGHNHFELKQALLNYINKNGIVQSLDMATTAKSAFIKKFKEQILDPRKLNYKLQFCGPTGANAVEAALKLAKKFTNHSHLAAFNNSYHGLSMGALAVTDSPSRWKAIGLSTLDVIFLPYLKPDESIAANLAHIRSQFEFHLKNNTLPAALIMETVQIEGGINVAPSSWLAGLREITKEFGIIFIIDDIQAGCGRTGQFFSFESAKINPDIVCLSKSLSAYGLPMSMLLIKPEIDVWEPGEHTGTFRGNNLAFVTAAKALDFWSDENFLNNLKQQAKQLEDYLKQLAITYSPFLTMRGRGFVWGLEWKDKEIASKVAECCFRKGLIVETVGVDSQVLKLLPPLIIEQEAFSQGLSILEQAIKKSVVL
ncbi:MAG: Diaminobutyrate--2-oxoglutarate transaminase [Legionellaceae bacterium]